MSILNKKMSDVGMIYKFPNPAEKLEFTGERYVSGHKGLTQHAHHHRYLLALGFCEGKSVLDVACGEGYGSALLGTVSSSVIGVDIDEDTVAFATRNYGTDHVRFACAPAQKLPIPDKSLDIVVSFETIEHFDDHEGFISEISRVLKDDGILIISSPNKSVYSIKNNYNNPFHEKELELDEFENVLKVKFKNITLASQRQICGSSIVTHGVRSKVIESFATLDDISYEFADASLAPQYFVALASNADIPDIKDSLLFNDLYVPEVQGVLRYETRRSEEARGRVAALERELAAVKEQLRERESANGVDPTWKAEVRQSVSELIGATFANATSIDNLQGAVVSQSSRLDQLHDTIATAAGQSVAGLVEATFANATSIDKLCDAIVSQSSRLYQLHDDISTTAVRSVAGLIEATSANATRINGLQGAIVSQASRLDQLNDSVAKSTVLLPEISKGIARLYSKTNGSAIATSRRSRWKQMRRSTSVHLRRIHFKIIAAWRYPCSSKRRKAYRAFREMKFATGARLTSLQLRVRSTVRYPFSAKRRKIWRRRAVQAAIWREMTMMMVMAKSADTVASPEPALLVEPVPVVDLVTIVEPVVEVVPPEPVDPTLALHADLFDKWVSNTLGEYPASDFVPIARRAPPADKSDVKLIAYYLPQFHPIPENDKWWGKGFTEWRNVTRAYPHFEGHYQPRIPGELGYYDLRVTDVMRRQVELAKLHGIHAFCFHFYWFGGKTLLETPVKNYLENADLDLPFCLCWANENWSRRWDGSENEVLMSQSHSPDDDVAFLEYLNKYFQDSRYLKIDGRPVLTVYRPTLFPDAAATVERWRETAKRLGYPDLYLIATNSFAFSEYDKFGFDALSEFPPHHVRAGNIQSQFELSKFRTGWRVRSYAEIVETEKTRIPVEGTVHPGIMTSWDNSARRPANGEIIHGATPALFKEWLKQCFSRAQKNPESERLVFINAWNEWAEGTYLEPDKRYGYAYLDACASTVREHVHQLPDLGDVLPGALEWNTAAKTVLLCSHHAGKQIFGGERSFLDIVRALNASGFNVVVTLQESANAAYIEAIGKYVQEIRIFPYKQWTADALASLESVPRFLAVIDDIQPDLVYVNTIVVTAPLVAAKLRGVPAIVHAREIILHDEELERQIGQSGAAIVKQVARSCAHIIANSEATAICFKTEGQTTTIPNIVDVAEYDMPNETPDGLVRFGLISSNLPKKGLADFIELAKLCLESVPSARFLIIGPLSRPIVREYLGNPASVPANVEFVEYQPSSQDALKLVNVVVNFSHFQESFGRTVLEGMAAGRPTIVYDWGALPELVDEEVTGFIIPFGQPRAAVECVKMLADPAVLAKMSAEARRKAAESFDFPAFQQQIEQLAQSIMAGAKSDDRPYAEVRDERLAKHQGKAVDIVVCVHNALDDVKACLASVMGHIGPNHRIVLVDDGSADETKSYLEEFAASNTVTTLHRNDVAQGYTKAANIGVRAAIADLVILLNSDTIVTPFWAEKMVDAVFSVPGAGIVGPLSNAASYQSLPGVTGTATQTAVNALPDGFSPDDMNAWCEANSTAAVPCVPLVHGFCFGVTREAFATLGEFDEEAFPRGYGEENDFCFRAVNAGFSLVVATHTYVFHAKSKSYSETTRHELSEASQRMLYARHGRARFMADVRVLAEQPVLEHMRRESAKLFVQ